jgi:NADPH-dependent ferric siderophore reductase
MPSAPKWLFDFIDRYLLADRSLMVVSATKMLSPSVKQISFKGDFKKLAFKVGYYMDFRVADTEVRRYTISHIDLKNGTIDFVAHIHGDAPGSQLMNRFKPGDIFTINTPRGNKYYDEAVEKYVIFGDETSLALACSFLPILLKNKHTFQFYFELADENKDVPALLNLKNYTVFPKNELFRDETSLSNLPIFQTNDWQHATFVLTGNATSVQTFRKVIKKNTSAKVITHGYWLEGKRGL